jgi:hypothetical protein
VHPSTHDLELSGLADPATAHLSIPKTYTAASIRYMMCDAAGKKKSFLLT